MRQDLRIRNVSQRKGKGETDMKKNIKRWVALLLAVILVASTCLFSSDGFLQATEGTEESAEKR